MLRLAIQRHIPRSAGGIGDSGITARFRARHGPVSGRLNRDDYGFQLGALGPDARFNYDSASGRFVVGPLTAGEHLIHFRQRGTAEYINAENASLTATVSVRTGAVTNVSLQLQPTSRDEVVSFRTRQWRPVAGTALMPDSTKPAAGMRVLQFAVNSYQPVSGAWADARGHFSTSSLAIYGQGGDLNSPGSPDGPVLVAWVPGQTAKQIVPIPKDQTDKLPVVLTRGHRVCGQVTIGDESPLPVAAAMTLRLQHHGRGKLDPYLSCEITVDAGGRFDLTGVTPGRYSCQAALDNLWLSSTVELNVSRDLENVRLDIPTPGGPARVRFMNGDGMPHRHVRIDADWPPGPLTSRFHSEPLLTDHEGWLYIDGCPQGKFRVRNHTDSAWHDIAIPSLSAAVPEPQTVN